MRFQHVGYSFIDTDCFPNRHHRQVVVEKLGDGARELPFINKVIEDESKNYHAWSYRYEIDQQAVLNQMHQCRLISKY